MAEEEEKTGVFEWVFTVFGAISGASFGFEIEGWGAAIILAFVGGAIGMYVGRATDQLLKWIVGIVFLLINSFTRHLMGEFIRAIIGI